MHLDKAEPRCSLNCREQENGNGEGEANQRRERRRKGREHDSITAGSTVRGLSLKHWKVGANVKSAWPGGDYAAGERGSSLYWLTTIPWGWGGALPRPSWGTICLLRSHITSGEQRDLKLLLRLGQLAFKDTGRRFILSSMLLFICALLSTETSENLYL